jgi:hypothetical protein
MDHPTEPGRRARRAPPTCSGVSRIPRAARSHTASGASPTARLARSRLKSSKNQMWPMHSPMARELVSCSSWVGVGWVGVGHGGGVGVG